MSDLKNLIFGQLKVESYSNDSSADPLWDCVCNCGKEITVPGKHLLSGKISSCGCANDALTSESKWVEQRWGRLTAIKHMGYDVKIRKKKREVFFVALSL